MKILPILLSFMLVGCHVAPEPVPAGNFALNAIVIISLLAGLAGLACLSSKG